MKTKSKINGHIIRGVVYAVFLAVAFIAASSAFDSPNKWYKSAVATVGLGSTAKSPSQPRAFSFAERVAYQRAIEDVYWRHRIWPSNRGENPNPKPSLDAVMSQAQLQNKVADYLSKSQTLEDSWQRPITAGELQAEMDRMAQHTRQPGVLRELFASLGNDPFVVAECLARPLLAERLLTQSDSEQVKQTSRTDGQVVAAPGDYRLPSISDDGGCTDNTWSATTTAHAPSPRYRHTAVWTGSEMIVWGDSDFSNTGGRYSPSTDSWAATSTVNAPSGLHFHTAVWTGTEMIVWARVDYWKAGGRYNPSTNSWTTISAVNMQAYGEGYTAVWTGSEMIIWGGGSNNGGRYNPKTDTWRLTSTTNAPTARDGHSAVWTGSEMIVWGGNSLNTGGRYNPATNSWTATSTTNAPAGRGAHTAVWTGSQMIIWGGADRNGFPFSTGGRYNPATDSWSATSTTNAPAGRGFHTAVWTGNEMIVWGGYTAVPLGTGGRYNPDMNSWTATSNLNAPSRRVDHTGVWTGNEMIIWGGIGTSHYLNTGGRYCAPGSQLGNISTRAFVQTGDNVVIGGFIIQGGHTKRVIIRAIGPGLTHYGVPNALANPTLELHNSTGALIASNNNWATTIIGGIITANQVRDIQASGYAPSDALESAIIADLPPGNYTAIVRGVNNMGGVGLVEVYDLSPETSSTLGNISTRSFVQTGDNVMIGGFIVQGTATKRVIVRAIGPELTQHGVPNALANPTLELHNGMGALIASNNNWATTIIGGIITANQVHDIQASGYAPSNELESAIIADLPPGNYTAIVRGVNNTTGVGLVEVYDLD